MNNYLSDREIVEMLRESTDSEPFSDECDNEWTPESHLRQTLYHWATSVVVTSMHFYYAFNQQLKRISQFDLYKKHGIVLVDIYL